MATWQSLALHTSLSVVETRAGVPAGCAVEVPQEGVTGYRGGCLRVQAAAAAGDFRRSVHKKLIALEERQIDAQRRSAAARARSQALAADIAAARNDVARLLQTNQRLRAAAKAEEEWPRGARAALVSQSLGQVTAEVRPALYISAGSCAAGCAGTSQQPHTAMSWGPCCGCLPNEHSRAYGGAARLTRQPQCFQSTPMACVCACTMRVCDIANPFFCGSV